MALLGPELTEGVSCVHPVEQGLDSLEYKAFKGQLWIYGHGFAKPN